MSGLRGLRARVLGGCGICVACAALLGPPQGEAARRLSPATIAFWDRVAYCETGSRWGGLGSTYQGGLGFYYTTWNWWASELGLLARYPDAGDAPRLVQIQVADYGRRVHHGYWGCI